jgi:hypothetical protein
LYKIGRKLRPDNHLLSDVCVCVCVCRGGSLFAGNQEGDSVQIPYDGWRTLERPPLRFAASALKKSEISLVGLAKLLAKSKGKKKPPEVAAHALNSSILLSYGHNVMRTYTGFKTARSQV